MFDDAQMAQFSGQTRLRDFRFPAGTRFELSRAPDFSAMRALQFLSFEDSVLPPKFLSALAQTPILRRLNLNGCRFEPADFRAFCQTIRSNKFSDLWLENTAIGDADLPFVGQIARLEWLILSGTQVSDAGLPALLNLNKLATLSLGETQVSRAGILELAQLPALSIVAGEPKLRKEFFAAHIEHHKSPRPVDANARDEAQKVLLEFLAQMKDWETNLAKSAGAIRKKYASQRPQFNVFGEEEAREDRELMERAAREKAAIVERFCTPQLLAKGVAGVSSYGTPPRFDPSAETWIDVEQKTSNHLIFYSLGNHDFWRRFTLKNRDGWRLDAVQWFSDGRWQRNFY